MSNKVTTYHWSRVPGKFVNKLTGACVLSSKTVGPGPFFQGSVREWYETLQETIVDAANKLTDKLETEVTVSRDVLTILEHLCSYTSSPPGSLHRGTLGYLKFKVYVGPVKTNQIIVSDRNSREHAEILVQDLCII